MAIARVFTTAIHPIAAQRERFPLWTPVFLMVGIGGYFSLLDEPAPWVSLCMLTISIIFLAISWKRKVRIIAGMCVLIAVGFAAAQVRTTLVQAPLLGESLFNTEVDGVIESIDAREKGAKLVLVHPQVEDLAPERTPARIRLTFRAYDPSWHIGDRVKASAMLYPLPLPAQPGAYDFGRYLYFQGIGATGMSFRAPEIMSTSERRPLAMKIDAVRHRIAEDMRGAMPGAVGTVATAMTVGEMGPIPEATQELLRDAGLSHILSISGLHLSLAAGIVFFAVRLGLALIPGIALRWPVKKIAAAFALCSSFIYLLLAGYPIPAQRSFIMVAFVLLAIIVDRRGISMRSLMMAAALILLVFPESMLGASFQMSFSATLAIVAIYERFGRYLHRPHAGWIERGWRHLLGIVVTSMAATFATAPFVIYNFDRFSSFGLLSNMLVIPLAGFIIMPGVVVSLLLMPFGLQWIGYWPLAHGTAWMLSISEWVVALPYSSILLYAPTQTGMVVAAFGMIWLCLMRGRIALLGIPLFVIGMATMGLHISPDVFISGDGRQVMVRLEDGRYTMLKGSGEGFTAQAWLKAEGQEQTVKPRDAGVECTREHCIATVHHQKIEVLKKPQYNAIRYEACAEEGGILTSWWYLDAAHCPGPTLIIDRKALETYGAHTLQFKANGEVQLHTVWTKKHGHRPWEVAAEGEWE